LRGRRQNDFAFSPVTGKFQAAEENVPDGLPRTEMLFGKRLDCNLRAMRAGRYPEIGEFTGVRRRREACRAPPREFGSGTSRVLAGPPDQTRRSELAIGLSTRIKI
jgi:hypothetical protein